MNATLTLTEAPAYDVIDADPIDERADETFTTTIPRNTSRSSSRTSSTRRRDDYADVQDMFHHLTTLDEGTTAHQRHRDRIIERCMPMADHVALHFDRRGEVLDDLIQVARVGLMNAVRRFDPTMGSPFIAFAIPTMMGEVRRHFRDHAWTMHVPRRIRDMHVQISRATTDLTQQLGHAPTPTELATYLGADREVVVECLVSAEAYNLRSLDAPIGDEGGRPRMVADVVGQNDERLEHVTNREALRPLLAALPQRDRDVLEMRFFESMTQSQIAEKIGTSQMQVSRILSRILGQLREQLQ
jgi:RNA polymerase sigma-B factor